MNRFLDWLRFRNRRVSTGIYSRGFVYPHLPEHLPLAVSPRLARRLQEADRVEFVPIGGQARRVKIYRRPG